MNRLKQISRGEFHRLLNRRDALIVEYWRAVKAGDNKQVDGIYGKLVRMREKLRRLGVGDKTVWGSAA